MTHIGLVACVGKKRPTALPAKDLYDSPLFKKSRAFVEHRCDSWFVLSAKYGLVEPEQVIEPYEESLNTKSRRERGVWASMVWDCLEPKLAKHDRVTMLAGKRYRVPLADFIASHGCEVQVPMVGLGIGYQLGWLTRELGDLQSDVRGFTG